MADIPERAPDRSIQRASDADREQVVETLREAASEGRLDLDEFEERMTAAYAARTYGELDRLTRDLPGTAPASVPAAARQEVVLRAQGSCVRREGRWPVPRRLVIEAKHGSVRLDLSRAIVLATEIELRITARSSSVTVLIPPGTHTVDDGLVSNWSSAHYSGDDDDGVAGGGAGLTRRPPLQIRLTGEMNHSSIKVRPPTLIDVWGRRLRTWWRRLLRAR